MVSAQSPSLMAGASPSQSGAPEAEAVSSSVAAPSAGASAGAFGEQPARAPAAASDPRAAAPVRNERRESEDSVMIVPPLAPSAVVLFVAEAHPLRAQPNVPGRNPSLEISRWTQCGTDNIDKHRLKAGFSSVFTYNR